MHFRHEYKHEINESDMAVLRDRLCAVAKHDIYGDNGINVIRSIYFDDSFDTALKEKINGVNKREKFRIRFYNGDLSFIRVEKKSKINGLCSKVYAVITAEEAAAVIDGKIDFMREDDRPLIRELYCKMRTEDLRAKSLVEYTREAFVYPAGNTRITLDSNLRTGTVKTDFLNPDCVTMPVRDAPIILEVKWDAFLPDIIRDTVNLKGRRETAFSKYAACRMYG
ncbi:MAG: polyphosphate polymerase domain-containing protein [Clostridia bacterium]|nr:polyphosphate polymerase domain-containing protein [Clostridia bacterium]